MPELNLVSKLSLSFVFLLGILFIIYLIVKNRIKVEFGLLWILAFSVGSLVVLSSKILEVLTSFVGGMYPTAGLSVLASGFIFLLLIIFTAQLTVLNDKIKRLSQYIALLELRLRKYEDKNKDA